jgi:siroheme synthase (precorrin-2 oxidase/ferrochelatase)
MGHPHGLAMAAKSRIIEVRFAMSLEEAILEAVRNLLPDQQQEILNHATELRDRSAPRKQRKSVKGLWADLGVSLSAEEIDENRREMWRGFPRDDI